MAIATIICIGFGALLFIPAQTSGEIITPQETNPEYSTPATTDAPHDTSSKAIGVFIAVVIIALIAFGIYKSAHYYNNIMRKYIARAANRIGMPIYHFELLVSTTLWTIAFIFAYAFSPYFAIVTLFAMVTNLLSFTIAWLCYGQPQYAI